MWSDLEKDDVPDLRNGRKNPRVRSLSSARFPRSNADTRLKYCVIWAICSIRVEPQHPQCSRSPLSTAVQSRQDVNFRRQGHAAAGRFPKNPFQKACNRARRRLSSPSQIWVIGNAGR
jgi:hypothetical protein